MRAFPILVALESCLAVTACGGSSSSGSPGSIDAPGPGGGPSDAPSTPSTLTLSGTAKEISTAGQTAIAGVTLTAYDAADDSVLGTATSAADGTFSISVNTGTGAINGYLKATTPGTGANAYKDSYLYPPATLTGDYTGVPVYVLKVTTYTLANAVLVNNQTAQNGWIALLVEDAAAAPVAGAVVTSTPMGQINYNANNVPSTSAKSTAADGIAYDTNVAAGDVVVSATKTGVTFKSHSIKVRPDVVTLTLITP